MPKKLDTIKQELLDELLSLATKKVVLNRLEKLEVVHKRLNAICRYEGGLHPDELAQKIFSAEECGA